MPARLTNSILELPDQLGDGKLDLSAAATAIWGQLSATRVLLAVGEDVAVAGQSRHTKPSPTLYFARGFRAYNGAKSRFEIEFHEKIDHADALMALLDNLVVKLSAGPELRQQAA